MFITLTARNDGKQEIINADHVRQAWIDRRDNDDFATVQSKLMLRTCSSVTARPTATCLWMSMESPPPPRTTSERQPSPSLPS